VGDSLDPLTKLAFDILFNTDKPFTCFPSTHVSTSFIAAFTLIRTRIPFLIFSLLAFLISFSTLAIGQHYIYDALSGVAVATLSFYLSQKIKFFQMEENQIVGHVS
jgi:membrane-associated phospholipid phosphatase